MQQPEEKIDVNRELGAFLDPNQDRRRLANQIVRLLLDEDDFVATNALIAATAMLHCDPDIDKENAIELAKSFGQSVAEYIDEAYDGLVAGRRKYEAEMI